MFCPSPLRRTITLGVCAVAMCCPLSSVQGQDAAAAEGEEKVTIDRLAVVTKSPDEYRVHLALEPITTVVVPAEVDGVVSSVLVSKRGDQVRAQSEVIRQESKERQLELSVAGAELELAKLSSGDQKNGEAAVNVAIKRHELAEFRLSQTVLRAPLDATVLDIHVSPGEFVRAGQPLLTLIDTTKLFTEIPIERGSIEAGAEWEITVENQRIKGTVEAILPIRDRFSALRDIFVSVATARVVVNNPNGKLAPGQGVFSTMVPRHPVMEVPNTAVQNGVNGERKIQVIRHEYVRDLPIQLLGQVGETHVFVSARFSADDELIVSSSIDLADGTYVRPAKAPKDAATATEAPPARSRFAPPNPAPGL